MKKILLIAILLSLISIPLATSAAGIVPCGNPGQKACTINDFFTMLGNIYNFLVLYIAAPLAVLGLTIGGVLILISAGNPNLQKMGKSALWASFWGLVLALGSFLIIKVILTALKYQY